MCIGTYPIEITIDFTPNPEDFTPNPEDFTPNPEDFTPNLEDFTPNPEDFTPNPEDFTPNPEDFTPNPEDFTPNPEDFTPNSEDFTPNPEDSYSEWSYSEYESRSCENCDKIIYNSDLDDREMMHNSYGLCKCENRCPICRHIFNYDGSGHNYECPRM